MKNLKHFFLYSFLWQAKSFFLVIFLLVGTLLWMGNNPSDLDGFGIVVFYALVMYTLMLPASSIGSIGTNQHAVGGSFSSKYLLALPLSKKELIFGLLISNLCYLAPIVIFILWNRFGWDFETFNLTGESNRLLSFFYNYWLNCIGLIFLIYILMLLLHIRGGVEAPRKLYSKGTIYNYLLQGHSLVTLFFYLAIAVFVIGFVATSKNWVIVFVTLPIIVLIELFKTYRCLINESSSYWGWKKDLLSIAAKVSFVAILFFGVINSNVFEKKINKELVSSSEVSIFQALIDHETSEIQKYIDENHPLDLVSKNGIGLIHLFSNLDFFAFNRLENYYLQEPSLLLKQIHGDNTNRRCANFPYCTGVTPLHILVKEGNIEILAKALELVPEGVNIVDNEGLSLLHYSSIYCQYEITKLLLGRGSEVDQVSKSFATPLMNAVSNDCVASVVLFLKAGADTQKMNTRGQTARDIAIKNSHADIAFIIDQYN